MTLRFPAMVDARGTLQLHDREGFRDAVRERLPRNARVTVSVRVPSPQRDRWQNRHWWGYIVRPLADFCGYPVDEMHKQLKLLFLEPNVEIPEPGPEARTTTMLDPDEFQQLCQQVRAWAATDLHFVLEVPE